MKIPGWVVALMAVALLGAAGLWGLFAFAAGSVEGVVGACVLGVIAGWMMVRASPSGPRSSAPSGSRVTIEVPETVGLGGVFPVRAKLFVARKLPLNPHRQRVRFVIAERWLSGGDETTPLAIVHDEVLPVHAPLDTVGEWETTVTPRVPREAPTSLSAQWFQLYAWVEFSVPYGMFGELKVSQPVVIVSELAR